MNQYKHTIESSQDCIIKVAIVGDSDEAIAIQFVDNFEAILSKKPKNRFNVLVQMRDAGSSNPNAIRIYAGLMNNKQIHKIAFYETPALPKIFAEFVIKFAKKDLVKFVESYDEALFWFNK